MGSSKTAILALKITGDASDGARALDQAEGRLDGFGRKLGALGAIGVGAAVAGIVGIGKAAFDAAHRLLSAGGGIDAVFGDWALDIEQSADAAATAVGLSKSSYEELAAVIGSQLKGAGLPIDEVTNKTQGLVEMGADLAATFGGTTEDAVSALSSALKGETDPIERYGISLKQSDIQARLAAQGQDKLTGTALKTATAQAALALVTEQSAQAHGQFAAQGDTAATKAQVLSAWWENMKAKIGEGLLPIFVSLVDFFSTKVSPALEKLTADGGPLATALEKVGGFVTGSLIPALTGLYNELAPKVMPIIQTVGRILNDNLVPAFRAVWAIVQNYVFPILGSVLRPALDGLKSAWGSLEGAPERTPPNLQKIYQNVQPLLAFLRDKVAPLVGGALKLAFEGAGKVIGFVIDKISWVIEKGSQVAGIVGKLGNLFGGGGGGGGARRGAGLLGAARGAAPGLFGATDGLGSGGGMIPGGGQLVVPMGDTYTITVTGALDPDAVAAQIEDMLTRRLRATGRRQAVGAGAFG
jgi:hypothetical protein